MPWHLDKLILNFSAFNFLFVAVSPLNPLIRFDGGQHDALNIASEKKIATKSSSIRISRVINNRPDITRLDLK